MLNVGCKLWLYVAFIWQLHRDSHSLLLLFTLLSSSGTSSSPQFFDLSGWSVAQSPSLSIHPSQISAGHCLLELNSIVHQYGYSALSGPCSMVQDQWKIIDRNSESTSCLWLFCHKSKLIISKYQPINSTFVSIHVFTSACRLSSLAELIDLLKLESSISSLKARSSVRKVCSKVTAWKNDRGWKGFTCSQTWHETDS